MAMKEGIAESFEYRSWDGTNWIGMLELLTGQAFGINDPDFEIQRTSDWWKGSGDSVAYFTLDNSKWRSKCHSHSNAFDTRIWFTFEHFPERAEDAAREDGVIRFLDWDAKPWQLSVVDMDRAHLGTRPRFSLSRMG